jgi:diaminohydroxyphosphoribosylaminopyrimidine deaminase/5-amino-6-(5-phosphoribosylamino)uracil reductase
VPSTYKIFNKASETLVFTQKEKKNQDHLSYCKVDFSSDIIPQILKELHKRDIQSLIVEGGKYTLDGFIDAELWDEARVFDVPIQFKGGTAAPKLQTKPTHYTKILNDTLEYHYRCENQAE